MDERTVTALSAIVGRVSHHGLEATVGNTALRLTMQDTDTFSAGAPLASPFETVTAENGGGAGNAHSPGSAAPINGKKHSSGYSRLRERHRALIADHETLRGDFDALATMYREMENALLENAELLERLQSQRPTPRPQYRPEPMVGLQSLFSRGAR